VAYEPSIERRGRRSAIRTCPYPGGAGGPSFLGHIARTSARAHTRSRGRSPRRGEAVFARYHRAPDRPESVAGGRGTGHVAKEAFRRECATYDGAIRAFAWLHDTVTGCCCAFGGHQAVCAGMVHPADVLREMCGTYIRQLSSTQRFASVRDAAGAVVGGRDTR
jgi:hypothetical protein